MTGERQPGDDSDDLVTVGRYIDPIAAEFARSRLEADGLTCFIQGIGLGSLLPTATLYPILLQVPSSDAARAREILDEPPVHDEFEGECGPPDDRRGSAKERPGGHR